MKLVIKATELQHTGTQTETHRHNPQVTSTKVFNPLSGLTPQSPLFSPISVLVWLLFEGLNELSGRTELTVKGGKKQLYLL